VIANNTTVANAYSAEVNEIMQNITKNSNVQNFASAFVTNLSNTYNLNVQNVSSSSGKITLLVNNAQCIQATLQIVQKLDLTTTVLNTINSSDSFKVDQQVTTATQAIAQGSSQASSNTETVGSAVSSTVSSVGSALGSLWSVPIAIMTVGGLGALYLLTRGLGGGSQTQQINTSQQEPTKVENGSGESNAYISKFTTRT
jgi:hypothetical protein